MGRFKSPHSAVSQVRTDWKWALSTQLRVIWKRVTETERCDFKRKESAVSTNSKQHILAFFSFTEMCYTHVRMLGIRELILNFSLVSWSGKYHIKRNAGLRYETDKTKILSRSICFPSKGKRKTVFHVWTRLLHTRERVKSPVENWQHNLTQSQLQSHAIHCSAGSHTDCWCGGWQVKGCQEKPNICEEFTYGRGFRSPVIRSLSASS